MNERFSRRESCLLAVWLVLVVLLLAHGSLTLPYLSDDYEHGQLIAQIRAGLAPGYSLFTVPFHGQWDVLLRILFWFGTLWGGMSLAWIRLAIWIAHAAGAIGCALLVLRWTGSKLSGWIAGTLYAGAVGFIGEAMWWPSSGIFVLGLTFFIFAMLALDRGKIWLCLAMVVLAALGLNGILAAALGLPVSYWLFRRKRPPIWTLAAAAALFVIGFWRVGTTMYGLRLGAWLIYTAPFRFFDSWIPSGFPGFRTIVASSSIAWLAVLGSVWLVKPEQRRMLFAVWTPAILLALVTGMARAEYPFRFGPGSLYTADRYYYVFLLPLVVQCALLLSRARWLSLAVLVALVGSRAHYMEILPRANFEASGHALERGRRLVETMLSSPEHPLLLTDTSIPLDGARNNAVTLAFLIYSDYPRGIPGVRVVHGSPDPRQQARTTPSSIDFKNASYEEDLESGFSWWEPPYRWMSGRGSLHLKAARGDLVVRAYAPVDKLGRAIHVTVAVNGKGIGELGVREPGTRDYRLEVAGLPEGKIVTITLTSDTVWHARDIFPDSLDDRDLSIALSSIGFAVRP